jgi:hypothetical protein
VPLPSPHDYEDWRDFADALVLAMGSASEADSLAGSIDGSQVTGSIPATVLPATNPDYTPVYWSTPDQQLFLSPDFVVPPPVVLPFQIDTQSLALLSVDTNILADDAVINSKILNATILSAKIGDAQIIEAKIADLAVTTAKIADLAVLTAKIGDAQITTAKVGSAQIGTAQIGNASITNALMANAAIGSAQIIDASILTADIASAQITSALIAAATILTANIGAGQITNALIADATILAAKIADATITSAKIASLVVDKITAGTLDAVIDMGTGLIRFTIAGNVLVLGKGFGTTNQFVMWFGPTMAENLMDESTAVFYLKTNGDAYFGGSLIAGTLVNGSTNSSLSDPNTVETGSFGSTGASRVVTATYSYSIGQRYTGGSPAFSGTDTVDLYIDKFESGSWVQKAHVFFAEADYTNHPPGGGGDPGLFSHDFGGSVQWTDNTGELTVGNIRARSENRTTIAMTGATGVTTTSQQQRLGIQVVEQ